MAKKYVRLTYEFEFDPGELWSHKSEFDHHLAEFFAAYQIEAELVDYIGSPGTSLLRLSKMDPLSSEPTARPEPATSSSKPMKKETSSLPRSVRQQINDARLKIQKRI